MGVEFRRVSGAVRQDGELIALADGEEAPPPGSDDRASRAEAAQALTAVTERPAKP